MERIENRRYNRTEDADREGTEEGDERREGAGKGERDSE